MSRDQALALLARAQQGDGEAHKRVALYCYERYLSRVAKLYEQADAAMSPEDMQMTFFEGIMRAILIVDERGDPLYHIGQRGIWNVLSELRVIRRQMRGRAKVTTTADDNELQPWLEQPDPAATDAFERAEDKLDVIQRLHIIASAPLQARERQAVEVIFSGAAGDPRETGFNKRLAAEMGVSPQRASQVMGSLRGVIK